MRQTHNEFHITEKCTVPSQKRTHRRCTLHWPRLGGGLTFEASVSRLYAKERPGKLPTLASQLEQQQRLLTISALFKHGYRSRARAAAILSLCVVECNHFKWMWLRSLAVYRLFQNLQKCGIKLVLQLFNTLLIDITQTIRSSVFIHQQSFELRFQGQLHMGAYSSKHQTLAGN